jgi:spore germination cell wall hydrolase CwlJ-like protein
MAALIIVAVVIIMAMITKKSQDPALFYTCKLVRKMPQFSYARRAVKLSQCVLKRATRVEAAENPPASRKNSFVYDTRTITPAKLTLGHFITFLESASYGF